MPYYITAGGEAPRPPAHELREHRHGPPEPPYVLCYVILYRIVCVYSVSCVML